MWLYKTARATHGEIKAPTASRCFFAERRKRNKMTKNLEGKTAVITGGTEGIGLASAKLFVQEGAYVFITGRRSKELDEAVKAIGSNVSGVQGDVAQLADLDRLYETVSKVKGRIDIVFANAGLANLFPLGPSPKSISTSYSTSIRGTLFTVLIGQLATTIGYEPLFVCLSVFDIVALLVVWVVLGERRRTVETAAASATRAG